MRFNNREDIIALTPLWKGERFEDGRPKVPQKYLDEMKKMTLEELWDLFPIFHVQHDDQWHEYLKKIEELTGLDLNDTENDLHLLLSCIVLRTLGEFTAADMPQLA